MLEQSIFVVPGHATCFEFQCPIERLTSPTSTHTNRLAVRGCKHSWKDRRCAVLNCKRFDYGEKKAASVLFHPLWTRVGRLQGDAQYPTVMLPSCIFALKLSLTVLAFPWSTLKHCLLVINRNSVGTQEQDYTILYSCTSLSSEWQDWQIAGLCMTHPFANKSCGTLLVSRGILRRIWGVHKILRESLTTLIGFTLCSPALRYKGAI